MQQAKTKYSGYNLIRSWRKGKNRSHKSFGNRFCRKSKRRTKDWKQRTRFDRTSIFLLLHLQQRHCAIIRELRDCYDLCQLRRRPSSQATFSRCRMRLTNTADYKGSVELLKIHLFLLIYELVQPKSCPGLQKNKKVEDTLDPSSYQLRPLGCSRMVREVSYRRK